MKNLKMNWIELIIDGKPNLINLDNVALIAADKLKDKTVIYFNDGQQYSIPQTVCEIKQLILVKYSK